MQTALTEVRFATAAFNAIRYNHKFFYYFLIIVDFSQKKYYNI